jgi:tRNA nucleotidyltransferase (CCA-adding enzyme)
VKCDGVEQPKIWHKHDVYRHTMEVVDHLPQDKPLLRLAGVLHDLAKPRVGYWDENKGRIMFLGHDEKGADMAEEIMRKLKFSNDDIKYVRAIVEHHMTLLNCVKWRDTVIRRWINRVSEEYVDDLITFRRADAFASKVPEDDEMDRLQDRIATMPDPVVSIRTIVINGNDVMRILNLDPGPKVGTILRELEDMVIEDPSLNTRETLIEWLENQKE